MSPAEVFAWAVNTLIDALPDATVIHEPRDTPITGPALIVDLPEAVSSEASLNCIVWDCQISVHAASGGENARRGDLLALAERAATALFTAGGYAISGNPGTVQTGAMNPLDTYTIRVTAP